MTPTPLLRRTVVLDILLGLVASEGSLLPETHAAEVLQCLAMPTCVLRCESCRVHTPYFIHEEMMPEVQSGKAVPKHCPVCRTTTDWMFVFLERRSGRERRQIADRRTPTP